MAADLNPYASPQAASDNIPVRDVEVLKQLRAPSIGLLTLSTLHCGIYVLAAIIIAAELILRATRNLPIGDVGGSAEELAQFLVIIPNLFIGYGAWCMRRNVHYRVALASAIIACIPFLSPFIFFGIPFGLWAAVVLRRLDVQAAFAAKNATKISAGPNPS